MRSIVPNEELVGLGTAIASRLIPFDNFNPGQKASELLTAILSGMRAVGDNVLTVAPDRGLAYGGAITQILITTPYLFKNPPPSAVTPAWRTAVWHLLFAPTFNYDATPAVIADAWSRANSAMDFVRDISPPGAYQNEAALYEPNHEESFWGRENYEKVSHSFPLFGFAINFADDSRCSSFWSSRRSTILSRYSRAGSVSDGREKTRNSHAILFLLNFLYLS